jgi:hypothetical protein
LRPTIISKNARQIPNTNAMASSDIHTVNIDQAEMAFPTVTADSHSTAQDATHVDCHSDLLYDQTTKELSGEGCTQFAVVGIWGSMKWEWYQLLENYNEGYSFLI